MGNYQTNDVNNMKMKNDLKSYRNFLKNKINYFHSINEYDNIDCLENIFEEFIFFEVNNINISRIMNCIKK